jgi:N-acetylneuraminic acid mutarotase
MASRRDFYVVVALALVSLMSCSSSTPRARTSSASTLRPSRSHVTASPSSSVSLPKLPYVVERAAGAVIGDTGYILGGLIPGDSSISSILSIDLATGVARRAGSLPIAAHDAAAVSVGNVVWLLGGSDPAGRLVQRFDPAAGTVSTIGHLPRVLSDLAATIVGNTIYVVGGYDGSRARPEILATTDGRSFRVVAMLPRGLRYAAVAAAGGSLVVAGGQTDSALATRTVYLVDPGTGSVRMLAELPSAVSHAVLLVRGDTAFLIGGRDSAGSPTARVWRISISIGAVSASTPIPLPLGDPTLLSNGSQTLLAGGATGTSSTGGETNAEIRFA